MADPNAPANPAPPPVVTFTLNPQATMAGPVNCGTSHGLKVYEMATKTLSEEKFDCVESELCMFLMRMGARSHTNGWETVMDMPVDNAGKTQKCRRCRCRIFCNTVAMQTLMTLDVGKRPTSMGRQEPPRTQKQCTCAWRRKLVLDRRCCGLCIHGAHPDNNF